MLQIEIVILINLLLKLPNHEHDTLGYLFKTNHPAHAKYT